MELLLWVLQYIWYSRQSSQYCLASCIFFIDATLLKIDSREIAAFFELLKISIFSNWFFWLFAFLSSQMVVNISCSHGRQPKSYYFSNMGSECLTMDIGKSYTLYNEKLAKDDTKLQ